MRCDDASLVEVRACEPRNLVSRPRRFRGPPLRSGHLNRRGGRGGFEGLRYAPATSTDEGEPPRLHRMSVDVDVLVVGAGLSGIGAACHLEERLPGTSYAVLEARETSGPWSG